MDHVARFYSGPGKLVAAIASALDAAGLSQADGMKIIRAMADRKEIRFKR